MNKQLETAEYWRSLGIGVLPIQYRSKRPDATALRQAGFEHNGAAHWQPLQCELPSEWTLRLWFSGPQRNIAVITGWQGLVVIDFDQRDAYEAWLQWASSANEIAATVATVTYRVYTRRGVHVYVSIEEIVPAYHVGAIDIKAAGGYVLAPPSIHPSGARYSEPAEYRPVCRAPKLSNVFPLTPPPPHHTELTRPVDDPWSWHEHAASVSIGMIRDRVKLLDLFPDAHCTSGDQRWWMARCPWHQDDNPSLWIDATRGICGCLAGCTDKPLDVINVYQRLHNMSQRDAIHALAERI